MSQAATLRSNAWLQAADYCFQLRWFKLQRCVKMLDFKLLIVVSSCWWFKLQRCVQMLDFKLLIIASNCDNSSCNTAFKCLTSSYWLLLPAAMIQAATLRSNAWLQAAVCCFRLRWFKLQRCVQMLDIKLLIVASSCWWFKLQCCVQMLDFKLLIVASSCNDSSSNTAFKCLTSSYWLLLPAAMIQAATLRSNAWLQATDCCFQLQWFKQQRCVQMLDFKLLIVVSSCWWFKLQRCFQMLLTSSC